MARLPQELLEAILHELYDVPSLKNCSLSGSQLCPSAQRLLLHKLRLRQNIPAALTLLEESPHVAPYFTTLHLTLTESLTSSAPMLNMLTLVLNRLSGVTRCEVYGRGWWAAWASLELRDAFWALIRTRAAHDLRLHSISKMPRDIFWDLLGATRSLHVEGMYLFGTDGHSTPAAALSGKPSLKRLYVGGGALLVLNLFANSSLSAHLHEVEHLTLFVSGASYAHCLAIIRHASASLRSLELHALNIDTHSQLASFPPLPALRQVDFVFDNSSRTDGGSWLASVLPSLLSPAQTQSPSLEDVHIRFEWLFNDTELDPFLRPSTLATLDGLLSQYPSPPRISWTMPRDAISASEVKIRHGLPLSNARGSILMLPWTGSGNLHANGLRRQRNVSDPDWEP
ncbi:Peroxidase [Mycena chlorophos]|uniref:Peroxidase n=1 Tax=Mycena chlorophos TaxID=658473 RepID=A0A8H6TC23_MYCCL|nr:Peroxidase [Mycena chlorophos]